MSWLFCSTSPIDCRSLRRRMYRLRFSFSTAVCASPNNNAPVFRRRHDRRGIVSHSITPAATEDTRSQSSHPTPCRVMLPAQDTPDTRTCTQSSYADPASSPNSTLGSSWSARILCLDTPERQKFPETGHLQSYSSRGSLQSIRRHFFPRIRKAIVRLSSAPP